MLVWRATHWNRTIETEILWVPKKKNEKRTKHFFAVDHIAKWNNLLRKTVHCNSQSINMIKCQFLLHSKTFYLICDQALKRFAQNCDYFMISEFHWIGFVFVDICNLRSFIHNYWVTNIKWKFIHKKNVKYSKYYELFMKKNKYAPWQKKSPQKYPWKL